ncbi:unnamed protein product [Cylicocyclus nassatus]|uniref:Uncharacterized protein n=1 Tax=Cylicocyclus nassatus TaxID=53992 RepID=A0AA36GTI0_CYLNA|nr:unnamed protein product [Cylicocyclus nassatus]
MDDITKGSTVQDSGDYVKEHSSVRSPVSSVPQQNESFNASKEKATSKSSSTIKNSSEHVEDHDTIPTTKTTDSTNWNASQTPIELKKSSTRSVTEMRSMSAKSPAVSSRETQESERVVQISEAVRYKKDTYMLIISVVTIVLSMFAFLVSNLLGILKIITTVLITVSLAIGWMLRTVLAVNTAIVCMIFAAGTDVTIIAEAVQGNSAPREAFLAILSSLMCIAVFIHLFVVTNDVRLRYKSEQSEIL